MENRFLLFHRLSHCEEQSEEHMRKVLLTAIKGRGGCYLIELLLEKGHIVCGIVRRSSSLDRSLQLHLNRLLQKWSKRIWS